MIGADDGLIASLLYWLALPLGGRLGHPDMQHVMRCILCDYTWSKADTKYEEQHNKKHLDKRNLSPTHSPSRR
jgi:hypothetical protein